MKDEAYERTLKARAFDVARYLLPLATNTSLGQIVNARTLETQVSRLLSSEFAEIRDLGEKLRDAATEPAWNVTARRRRASLCDEAASFTPTHGGRRSHQPHAAPARSSRAHAGQIRRAQRLPDRRRARAPRSRRRADGTAAAPIDPAPVVDLVETTEASKSSSPPRCSTRTATYSYRQLRAPVAALCPPARRRDHRARHAHRGRHDELLRAFSRRPGFRFDILMDIGGFRDMHRHRRCVQLIQGFTDLHGYETPHRS
jgi:hypothetical protein